MSFNHLKVGDKVNRKMGNSGPKMLMVVEKIDDKLIYCNAAENPLPPSAEKWMFDIETGIEEDEELGWGRRFGKTGTFLLKV